MTMQDKKSDAPVSEDSNLVIVTTPEYVKDSIKEAIEQHAASRNHPYATLDDRGFVTLSNDVCSDSETHAATSKAVKAANDLANKANDNADTRLAKDQNGADIPNKEEFVKNLGLAEGSVLPVGVPVPWPTETAPEGWFICNGEPFDKSKYPKLAIAYPSGVLPDLRGEFIRGWDNERGVDSNRTMLSWQEGSYVVQEARTSADNVVNFSLNGREELNWDTPNLPDTEIKLRAKAKSGGVWHTDHHYDYHYIGVTRPRNIAFNYIVRAA
ncbi:phage tail protein [Xenorhabdus sp. psl]|nr:phage tail protein [Xenorhabdus sp. psl]